MKNLFLYIAFVFALIFSSGPLMAQKKKSTSAKEKANPTLILADKHYNNFEYYLAGNEYARVLKSDSSNAYAMFQLAECYRLYYDYKNAEKFYQKVANRFKDTYPLARYWYATMLKDNGNYKKAIDNYERYRTEHTDSDLETELYREKAYNEIKGCYVAMEENTKPKRDYGFKCLPKPVNSQEGDYSPVIYQNDTSITLTSARKGSVGGHRDHSLGGAFSDVYRFEKKSDTTWTQIKTKDKDEFEKLNTQYNESAGSFTGDQKKYYFTRCDEIVKIDNFEEFNCAVYVSYFKDGKWQKAIRLNESINVPGQWNSQPSVSPDGNILFFVSKRPGGLGSHDIWYSTCNNDDQWGPPINLGDRINTLFADVSPRYYADQKVLFFSSNGHGGHGGLDIFMTKEDDGFQTIINLGLPFNSNRDDFYFVLGEKKGFVTSNRQGGVGSDDVYMYNIKSKKVFVHQVEDSLALDDNYEDTLLATNTTTTPPATDVNPEIKKIDSVSTPIKTPPVVAQTRQEVITKIAKDNSTTPKMLAVEGVLIDSITKKPSAGIPVQILDEVGNVILSTKTNEKGEYKFQDLPSSKNIIVELTNPDSKTQAFVKTKPIIKYTPVPEQTVAKEVVITNISKEDQLDKKSFAIAGTIKDAVTNKPVSKGQVQLVDEFGNIVKVKDVDANGNYSIDQVSSDKSFKLVYKTDAKASDNFIVDNHKVNHVADTKVPETTTALITEIDKSTLPDAKSITIDGIILYDGNRKPAAGATILLVDENGSTLKTSKTDKSGYYKFSNLPGGRNYKVILQQGNLSNNSEEKKYLAEKVNVRGSESPTSKNLFESIYFDFDSYSLRPEAKKVLDDLVEFCKGDANIQIELYANTDSYGSSQYNKILSANRGKSAMEYMVSKGMAQSSMVVNSIGETKSIASNDSELGRQLNRRVEFYILGNVNIQSPTMTYVIEPKKTLFSLAKEYNMSVDELKELNGLVGDELVAYTPIRVKRRSDDNDIIAPQTRSKAYVADKKQARLEKELIDRNKKLNENFDYNNPEYKKYVDSMEISDKNKGSNSIGNNRYEGSDFAYYITQPKNTLYNIARLYGVNVEGLKAINNLKSDTIFVGQKIKVDFTQKDLSVRGYLVKEGDTIGGIAKRFGLTIDELMENNNLDGYILRKNMILRLKK